MNAKKCPRCGEIIPPEVLRFDERFACPSCGQTFRLRRKAGGEATIAGQASAEAASEEATIPDAQGVRAPQDATLADEAPTLADAPGLELGEECTIADAAASSPGEEPTIPDAGGATPVDPEAPTIADPAGGAAHASAAPESSEETTTEDIAELPTEPGELPSQPVPGLQRSPDDALLGHEIAGCKVLAVAGRGAMGTVFKATQVDLDRVVALKTIRADYCADKQVLARFRQEARTVGQFNTPYVVQIYQIGQYEDLNFLVMEYLAGGNLLDFASREPGGRLSPKSAVRFLGQAASGLLEAERLGIVHRDIKPENILLDPQRRLKIADFGISKIRDASVAMTATGNIIGTPRYMSPEQCKGVKELDHRSDMYSLGATFFHLMTGELPAAGNTVFEIIEAKLKIPALSLRSARPEAPIPEALEKIIARMTALDPEDRYPSFADLIRDIERVRRGLEPRAQAPEKRAEKTAEAIPGPTGEDAPARKSALARFLVVLIVLGALGGGGFWAWKSGFLDDLLKPKPSEEPGRGGEDGKITAISPAQAQSELQRIRSEFATRNPSTELRLRALSLQKQLPAGLGELRASLAVLINDLVAGIGKRDRLASLPDAPAAPQPPFTILAGYVRQVRDILAAPPDAGEPFQTWLRERRTRLLAGLDDRALKALEAHAARCQSDLDAFSKGELDSEKFRAEVDRLARGREQVLALFPALADQLDARVPAAELAAMKRAIEQAGQPGGARADARELQRAIAAIRAEFAHGPEHKLLEDARQIKKRLGPGMEAIGAEIDALINDLGVGLARTTPLERLRQSPPIEVPFERLAPHLEEIRSLVEVPPKAGEELRGWLAKQERQLAGGLDEQALAALLAFLGTCREERRLFARGELAPATFEQHIAKLKTGRDRLAALFPTLRPRLDEQLPEKAITELSGALDLSRRVERLLRDFDEDRETEQLLEAVANAIDWRAAQEKIGAALKTLESNLVKIHELDGSRDLASQNARISRLKASIERWREHTRSFLDALRLFGERRLEQSATLLEQLNKTGLEDPLVPPVRAAVAQMQRAFGALMSQADLATAERGFAEARTKLEPLKTLFPAAFDYPRACLRRLAKLKARVAAGMSPVRAAQVLVTGAAKPAEVGTFFIDRYEVSKRRYLAFLEKLAPYATVAAMPQDLRKAWSDAKGRPLEDALRDARARLLPKLRATASLNQPVEAVSYDQARAFLRAAEQDFPTFEEWWLAAKGDYAPGVPVRLYAWGDTWPRMPGVPLDVDQGEQWITEGSDTYHLCDNVAEWLRSPSDDDPRSQIAGGSYRERKREFFSGKERRSQHKNGKAGIGFRGVIEVDKYFRGLSAIR